MRLYTGHIPAMDGDPDGVDVLLEVHDDDTLMVSTRPGRERTHVSWSAPEVLAPARVTS